MSITLNRLLEVGETAYIGKHNANYDILEGAVSALQTNIAAVAGSELTLNWQSKALFGINTSVISSGSYLPTGAGSVLTVAAGYVWRGDIQTVTGKLTSTDIDFSGLGAATYYITVGEDGEPVREASDPGYAIYSVVWDGGAFGTITRLVDVALGFDSFQDALTNAALGGQTFEDLSPLLEAIAGSANAIHSESVAGADITLTDDEAMNHAVIALTGAPQTADINLIVPDHEKPYIIVNDCAAGFSVTVKTAAGTGVELADGKRALVLCDGTNVIAVLVTAGEVAQPYDVGLFVPGAPGDGAKLFVKRMVRTVTFPAGLTESRGGCETAATAEAVFSLQKNGVQFGTATIAAAGTSVTFAAASETVFAAGDKLSVVAPSPQDSTLADLDITLVGER